jgi:hypothetical protein
MTETAVAEKPKRHPHRKDYTDQEVDAGLTAYAICSGRHERAAALLKKETGFEVPPETIRGWARRTHPDRYERIREEVAPKLQRQMADTHQGLADMAAEMETEAVERLRKEMQSGEVEARDLSTIFKNAAIASGIHTEKAELLNGRPTSRRERSADEVLRSLEGKGLQFIEGEAEEIEESGSDGQPSLAVADQAITPPPDSAHHKRA